MIPEEPGARSFKEIEVRNSIGIERAKWKQAAETEVQESYYKIEAVSIATPEDIE